MVGTSNTRVLLLGPCISTRGETALRVEGYLPVEVFQNNLNSPSMTHDCEGCKPWWPTPAHASVRLHLSDSNNCTAFKWMSPAWKSVQLVLKPPILSIMEFKQSHVHKPTHSRPPPELAVGHQMSSFPKHFQISKIGTSSDPQRGTSQGSMVVPDAVSWGQIGRKTALDSSTEWSGRQDLAWSCQQREQCPKKNVLPGISILCCCCT